MAKLFTVTAPLTIRSPNGDKRVAAALYPHPEGILYFELYWDVVAQEQGIEFAAHVIRGEIKGEGPWKVGDHVLHVLGCHGSEPQLAHLFECWQQHCQQKGYAQNSREMLIEHARKMGALC
ncbi:MAG: hypothetical protein OEZ43_00290 [Gammaproteobacteria bacterium]|nr:hypothetical protein [Gammaproteobacteria bacterium]